MKNNRRNRKLQFIRTKNNLRLGLVSFYVIGKISKDKADRSQNYIIENAKKQLYKNYKLILNNITIRFGHEGDDFVKDLFTYKVEIKK